MYPIYIDPLSRMEHVHSRANDFGPSSPRTARPAARLHSPPRTPWAARMLGSARPAACNAPPTPRALRAARRARLRVPAPCDDSPPRLPMRGTSPHSRPLPLSVRACTPPPGVASSTRAMPSAEPVGSPAASPMRRRRPAPCAPLMGGAGWADPLPAMRAALRDCGIRLTHKRTPTSRRRGGTSPTSMRSCVTSVPCALGCVSRPFSPPTPTVFRGIS